MCTDSNKVISRNPKPTLVINNCMITSKVPIKNLKGNAEVIFSVKLNYFSRATSTITLDILFNQRPHELL